MLLGVFSIRRRSIFGNAGRRLLACGVLRETAGDHGLFSIPWDSFGSGFFGSIDALQPGRLACEIGLTATRQNGFARLISKIDQGLPGRPGRQGWEGLPSPRCCHGA